ncbi:hypothetical protein RQP46_004930 [Phenoliferia psychrophenolica]
MSSPPDERGPLPSDEVVRKNLLRAVEVADKAAAQGRHPFGSILVGPSGDVLYEQGNENTLNHAELRLAQRAFADMTPEDLWKCTLYTNFEPCCMCTGAIYWANIGRIVYGAPETALLELTGNHPENPTMKQSARETLSKGSKDIQVVGPVPEVREAVFESHRTFWKTRG